MLGLVLGVVPIISVVVLDALIVKSGLSEKDLFAGAELREPVSLSIKTLLIQISKKLPNGGNKLKNGEKKSP